MFARLMVQEIAAGNNTREGLRRACQAAGMTADEEKQVFHGWGGTLGELSLLGVICAQVQEKKAYRLCALFAPMDAAEAELTLARRTSRTMALRRCWMRRTFSACRRRG